MKLTHSSHKGPRTRRAPLCTPPNGSNGSPGASSHHTSSFHCCERRGGNTGPGIESRWSSQNKSGIRKAGKEEQTSDGMILFHNSISKTALEMTSGFLPSCFPNSLLEPRDARIFAVQDELYNKHRRWINRPRPTKAPVDPGKESD
jgi:hypothetical protein